MNILVTTFGTSWQIVPELYGFTNPEQYAFFETNEAVAAIRRNKNIEPVDEIWVITVNTLVASLERINSWAANYPVRIRTIICLSAKEFESDAEVRKMRSCIYKTVLAASYACHNSGKLYLSLTGGRKTMSADMQQAGNLFGCDAMLHIIDLPSFQKAKSEFNVDQLLYNLSRWSNCFLPIIFDQDVSPNDVLVSSLDSLQNRATITFDDNGIAYDEDLQLLEEIEKTLKDSEQLYNNFHESLNKSDTKGDIFKGLYFLDNKLQRRMEETPVTEEVHELIKSFPKCELHTHLGGVLNATDIIETAVAERKGREEKYPFSEADIAVVEREEVSGLIATKHDLLKISDFKARFKRLISFICCFEGRGDLFERVIYDDKLDSFFSVDLDQYQKYGDLQGSALLQTETAIRTAIKKYCAHLNEDNIKYVELRCSPNKYTRCGLSIDDVVNCIISAMNESGIEYRLIFIIGRNASTKEIRKTVDEIVALRERNKDFREKFVGVDLAGTEEVLAPKEVRELFLPLLEECVYVTIHAGETMSVENIWQAVYYLSADRIGHGLKLAENDSLLHRFVDKRIGIELCPSSNNQVVGFKNGDYPLKTYLEKGLKVTINTDNMGISRTTLTDEFIKGSIMTGGISVRDCIVMIRNSLAVSFLNSEDKRALMKEYEKEIGGILLKWEN